MPTSSLYPCLAKLRNGTQCFRRLSVNFCSASIRFVQRGLKEHGAFSALRMLSGLTILVAVVSVGAGATPRETAPTSLEEFEVNPALELSLVAAEPLVSSPVAIAFDEHGRLFVAEMIDYPYDNAKLIGRVSRLTDTDGDGRYDQRTTFADKLSWPSGIFCTNGGVLVASTPHLLFLKDTDGDGQADVKKIVYTGFGNTRPSPFADMVVNGLSWGLDNRIHGATSINNGRVVPGDDPQAEPLDLTGRDFSLDPATWKIRPESGGSQFGLSFDAFGRKFVTNASFPSLVMYDRRYAERNPYFELPKVLFRVFAEASESSVFRISPEEKWRILRTQSRASGKTAGPLEGGRASGHVTSAAGVTIYRGDALPASFQGDLFLGEPANNLVLRKVLSPKGVTFVARRAAEEQQREVLRSRDVRFRPVNFANGPDGALYVIDMHRDLIEDAEAIPLEIRQEAGVNAHGGRETGRIYRLAAKGNRPGRMPVLTGLGSAELVAKLESLNGWTRDTAARLLFERQDRSATNALEQLAANSSLAFARIHALYALDGLGALTVPLVKRALRDPEPEVREVAVRLAELFAGAKVLRPAQENERAGLRREVLTLARDPAMRVRYQLAFTLGELPRTTQTDDALLQMALTDAGDEWISAATLASINDRAWPLLQRAAQVPGILDALPGRNLIARLLGIVGARARPDETKGALEFLAAQEPGASQMFFVNAFNAGLKRANTSLRRVDDQGWLATVFVAAKMIASDRRADEAARVSAIQLAAQENGGVDSLLFGLLNPGESRRIQITAMEVLGARQPPELTRQLITRWNEFTPPVRQEALKILLAAPERVLAMLTAVKAQKIRRSDISASQIQAFNRHPDKEVRETALAVFQAVSANRQKVIDDYASSLRLTADSNGGAKSFARLARPVIVSAVKVSISDPICWE